MKTSALIVVFALAFLGTNTISNAESLDRLAELMVRRVKIEPSSKCLFNVSEFIGKVKDELKGGNGDALEQAFEIKTLCEETCIRYCGSVRKSL